MLYTYLLCVHVEYCVRKKIFTAAGSIGRRRRYYCDIVGVVAFQWRGVGDSGQCVCVIRAFQSFPLRRSFRIPTTSRYEYKIGISTINSDRRRDQT